MAQHVTSPDPILVIVAVPSGMAYGWKCDKLGISVYGDSKAGAIANWREAVQSEYPGKYSV